MQCLQILQWCALGGLYISHLGRKASLIEQLLGDLLGADGPVLLGSHAATITVTVREVNTVNGQGNNTWVCEHCPGMGHEEQEYYDIEDYHMESAPKTARHGLKDNPPAIGGH